LRSSRLLAEILAVVLTDCGLALMSVIGAPDF
jgi:hypothetical protein